MKRNEFINQFSGLLLSQYFFRCRLFNDNQSAKINSVLGEINDDALDVTLIHEHIMVDFIGAELTGPGRYRSEDVVQRALPFLLDLKKRGCSTFVDCTPAYLGRDTGVLKELSSKSRLNILTNTGYYGAVGGKYLPKHADSENAEELAARWIREANEGIDGTQIKPGFIKIGVNNGPLNAMDRKLVEAAGITHLATGLTISSHTGDGLGATEQIEILDHMGVRSDAFRWVHAQNEKNMDIHVQVARKGGWVEFDGINKNSMNDHIDYVENLKQHDLLHRCLISQDSGWYHIGEENGGSFNAYTFLFDSFLPELKNRGFTKTEINLLLIENTRESLKVYAREK